MWWCLVPLSALKRPNRPDEALRYSNEVKDGLNYFKIKNLVSLPVVEFRQN